MKEYTERMKRAEKAYKELDTVSLWNKLLELDRKILPHVHRNKKNTRGPSNNYAAENKRFFGNLEESVALIKIMKERPRSEIYKIYEDLKSKLYVVKEDYRKKNIESHLGFIEREFFD